MSLSADQENLEHHYRIGLMRADTDFKLGQTRWEPWKVMTTAVTAAAAVFTIIGGVIGYMIAAIR